MAEMRLVNHACYDAANHESCEQKLGDVITHWYVTARDQLSAL